MKKLFLFSVIALAFSFTKEKKYKVEAPLPDWQKHVNKLEVIRQIADNSNMNNQEVKFITKSIDSLEMLIVPQIKSQLDSTKKK